MQRQEMLAQLQDAIQEPAGSLGAVYKGRLTYLLNRATDDVASKYKCIYGIASANLVANQALYSSPASTAETTQSAIIEIYAVSVYSSTGILNTIPTMTVQGMDAQYAGWRNWQANTCPSFAVTTAVGSSFILTPAPNYNSAYDPTGVNPGGYTVEGIAIPGHSWDALTAECPLPTQIHPAIIDLACLYRISQFPTKDNLTRAQMIREQMQSQFDTFDSTVIRYTQATRVPSYTSGGSYGGNSLDINPLDL